MNETILSHNLITHHCDFLYCNSIQKGFGSVIIFQTGALLHFQVIQKIEVLEEGTIVIHESATFSEVEESWDTLFQITLLDENKFDIELKNSTLGVLTGRGEVTPIDIHWKMYDHEGKTIGQTHFIKLSNGSYMLNSSYKVHQMTQVSIGGIISKATEE